MTRRTVAAAAIVVVAVAAALWVLDGWYADRVARETIDDIFADLPPGYDLTYRDADASIFSDAVTVRDLRIAADLGVVMAAHGEDLERLAAENPDHAAELAALDGVTLEMNAERWTVSDYDTAHVPPRFMAQEVDGFVFSLAPLLGGPDMASTRALLGGDEVSGGMRLQYGADEATGIVDFPYYELTLDNIGRLLVSGRVGGYHVWSGADERAIAEANAETVTLERLTVTYEDGGLVARLIDQLAAENGMTPKELKDQAALMIGAVVDGIEDQRVQASAIALAEFIQSPGRLQFELAPDEPVLLAAWLIAVQADPVTALDMMNASLTGD